MITMLEAAGIWGLGITGSGFEFVGCEFLIGGSKE